MRGIREGKTLIMHCVTSANHCNLLLVARTSFLKHADHFKAVLICSPDSPRHHIRANAFLSEGGKKKKKLCWTPHSVFAQWNERQTSSPLNRGGGRSCPSVPKQTQALPLWPTIHTKHGGELWIIGATAEETCSCHSTKLSWATVTRIWQEKRRFQINVWR